MERGAKFLGLVPLLFSFALLGCEKNREIVGECSFEVGCELEVENDETDQTDDRIDRIMTLSKPLTIRIHDFPHVNHSVKAVDSEELLREVFSILIGLISLHTKIFARGDNDRCKLG